MLYYSMSSHEEANPRGHVTHLIRHVHCHVASGVEGLRGGTGANRDERGKGGLEGEEPTVAFASEVGPSCTWERRGNPSARAQEKREKKRHTRTRSGKRGGKTPAPRTPPATPSADDAHAHARHARMTTTTLCVPGAAAPRTCTCTPALAPAPAVNRAWRAASVEVL
jgi:hypothetical protein